MTLPCWSFYRLYAQVKKGNLPMWFVLCAPITLNVSSGLYPVLVNMFASGNNEKPNPYIFTLYRDVCAAPVLFIMSYLIEGSIPLPNWAITLRFLVLGLIGISIGQCAYITGVYLIGPDLTSALQMLASIWTPLVTILLCVEGIPSFKKHHTYAKLIGVLTAVGGAMKLVFSTSNGSVNGKTDEEFKGQQVIGILSMLVESVCASTLVTLQKKWIYQRQNCIWRDYPIAMTAYIYLYGTILLFLATFYYPYTGEFNVFFIPSHFLPVLVYAVLITSAFCYFLLSWSNKYLPSSVVSAFLPLQGVVTVVAAYIFLGDEFTVKQCLCALLIITGLALVLYSNYVDEQLMKQETSTIQDSCRADIQKHDSQLVIHSYS